MIVMEHVGRVLASIVLVGLIGLFSLPSSRVTAETARVEWVGQTPTIQKIGDISAQEYNLLSSNISCEQKEVRVKYSLQQDSVRMGCLVPMLHGYVDTSNGQMLRYGEKYNFILSDDISGYRLSERYSLHPAANTDTVAFYSYAAGSLSVTTKFSQLFSEASLDWKKQVLMSRDGDFDFVLSNEPGKPVPWVKSGTISYSRNGKWMVVSTRDQADLRINLETFEILPFAKPVGLSYTTTQAVTNDGRFVAVFEPFNGLDVYDLEKCGIATGKLVNRNCQSMRMDVTEINKHLSADTLVARGMRFDSDNKLSMYVAHTKGGVTTHGQYSISVPAVESPVRYLALGDSFSSGEGAYYYSGETNYYFTSANFNVCHNSQVAYPALLNTSLKASWFGSVACSGAVSQNIASNLNNIDFYNKLSQARTDDRSDKQALIQRTIELLIPGYLPQLSMVTAHKPSVATITIGGNDIDFGGIIQSCILQPGCFSERNDREAKADEIAQKILGLTTTFSAILANMGSDSPRLYVVGYPKITSPDHHFCSLIGYDERQRADALVDYLNESIKIAAHNAGAVYVDTSDAFVDYEKEIDYRICGTKNIELAVNGALPMLAAFQNGSSYKTDQLHATESYHPNMLGQVLMAEKVRTMTNGLQRTFMYRGDRPIRPNEAIYARFVGDASDNLNVSQSYQRMTYFESKKRGSQIQLQLPADQQRLPSKNGSATVELHSDPIVLAEVPFDPAKDLTLQVTLPESVPAGYHTLHVLYTDINGNKIDFYQYLYVTASDDDFDGDGILNTDEECVIGGTLDVDYDEDGVDDACDPDITETAKEEPVAVEEDHESIEDVEDIEEKILDTQTETEIVAYPIAQAETPLPELAQNNPEAPRQNTSEEPRGNSGTVTTNESQASADTSAVVLGDSTKSNLEKADIASAELSPVSFASKVPTTPTPQESAPFWIVGSAVVLLFSWMIFYLKKHKH